MTDQARDPAGIRVIIADDERLIRDAFAALLGFEGDIEVAAVASSGEQALAEAARHEPDVALLDLQMPGMDGIETASALLRSQPDLAVMIVTSHGRPGYLKRALEAGVRGFVPKTVSAPALASAVRSVAAGSRYIDPDLATEAMQAGDCPLTARECDVLELAADGTGIDEIAAKASLSAGTVRNYLSSAMLKLDAANRHEAVATARRYGWI